MAQPIEYKRFFYSILEPRLRSFSPLIQILLGPRQIGKTTAVKQFVSENPLKSTYITFDNPGSNPLETLRFEWEKTLKRNGEQILILDEVQNLNGWASIVKELFDRDRLKRKLTLVILGSSALDILIRGEESLLGRYEIIRAPHWNFFEMSAFANWNLEQFLQFGGYPVIAELFTDPSPDTLRRIQQFVRDSIIEPVLTRDILTLRPVLNTAMLRQVLTLSLSLPCEEIGFSKLAGQLSEKGSSSTIKSYLELMEKAFLVKLLYRYSKGVIRQRTSSPKIVPLAPALVHAFKDPNLVHSDPSWFGHLFEMAVISRLSELHYDLYYWSDSRNDVDLILDDGAQTIAMAIKSNHKKDWKGLNAFKKQHPKASLVLLDREAGEELLISEKPAKVLEKLTV